jgi:hypothetical protein
MSDERKEQELEAQAADLEVPEEVSEQVRGGAEATPGDKFVQSGESVSGGDLIIELP